MKIKYSIIAPAIRSDLYKRFCENISKDACVSHEIVFVGHVPPKEKMPDNFKYIYAEVRNIVQCAEIAARNSCGEYLILTADDVVFSDKFLNRIDYYSKKLDMRKVLIGCRIQLNGIFQDNDFVYPRYTAENSPPAGNFPVFPRKTFRDLGGFDRGFSGALYELDMAYRFFEIGYIPFITPDCWFNEKKNINEHNVFVEDTMFARTLDDGKNMLDKLWFKDRRFTGVRNIKVSSFSDEDILKKDQYKHVDSILDEKLDSTPFGPSDFYSSLSYNYSSHKKISVLLVYRGDIDIIEEVIKNVFELSSDPNNIEFLARIDNDENNLYGFLVRSSVINKYNVKIYSGERHGYLEFHEYWNELAKMSVGNVLIPIVDEYSFMEKGWDEEIYKYENNLSIIYFNQFIKEGDVIHDYPYGNFCPSMTRRVYDILGVVSPTANIDLYLDKVAIGSGIQARISSKMLLWNRDGGVRGNALGERKRLDHLNSPEIKKVMNGDIEKIIRYANSNNISRKLLPDIIFGFGLYQPWFGKIERKDMPSIEIIGGDEMDYLVEFIDKDDNSVLLSSRVSPYHYVCCYCIKPKTDLTIKVFSEKYGVFYQKDVEVINYIVSGSGQKTTDKIDSINFSFIDGAKIEIIGEGNGEYVFDFIDLDTYALVHTDCLKINSWTKTFRTYYTNWLLRVKYKMEVVQEHIFSLKGKRCLIYINLPSEEEVNQCLKHIEEFRIRNNCDIYVRSDLDISSRSEYNNLIFVDTENIEDLYARYEISRSEDRNRVPFFGTKYAPIDQICRSILGFQNKKHLDT